MDQSRGYQEDRGQDSLPPLHAAFVVCLDHSTVNDLHTTICAVSLNAARR